MAGVRPESVMSWQEGDREQAKMDGREMQVWKEHVPMEGTVSYTHLTLPTMRTV